MNQPELVAKLSSLQPAIWPTVALQIGEATGQSVQLNGALVLECQVGEMLQEFAAPSVIVQFSFAGRRDSMQALILPVDTALAWTASLGETHEELDEAAMECLRTPLEAMVQGICLSIGNALNEVVVGSDLSVHVSGFARPSSMQVSDDMVRVQLALGIDSTVGSLTWLMDVGTARFMAGLPAASEAQATAFGTLPPFGGSRGGGAEAEGHGLEILMDIPLDISVELGRTRLVVKEVVDLGVGSIVEIDKAAGEPVDILVNGRVVARGEVVVIEDNFGVRITEILNPRERLARLSDAA